MIQIPGVDLVDELGHGTHSVVYRARRADGLYAVKMPLRNETGIKLRILGRRFRREAVALARIRHPLLPRVMDVGVVDRTPYIIMELATGETLAERLLRGPLSESEVVELGCQLASVLGQVHASGLVHRDVKPRNIVFDATTGQIRLVDFGFAASIDAAFRILEPVGTLEYAAPEQVSDLRQRVDGRADLYAVGCVMYECLTRTPPFPDLDPKRLLFQHRGHQIPDVRHAAPKTSSAMAAILARLLARNPDDRYASAAALQYDLERIDKICSGELTPSTYGDSKPITSLVPLVGRDRELARLRREWSHVESGQSKIVFLRGGTGSGKTRLAQALMDHAIGRGHRVLRAACHAWDPRPFAAIREIVEGNSKEISAQNPDTAASYLKTLAGDLAPLLKVLSPTMAALLRDVAPVPQSQDAQHIFVEGLAEFLSKLFREVGTAIVFVDDVQWLDASSRRVLRRALDRADDSKILYVFSARGEPAGLTEVDQFVEDLAYTQISLGRLTEKDIGNLICAYLGDPAIEDDLIRSVNQLSDGTPLSTLEVLRMMLDDGNLLPSWGRWRFDAEAGARMQIPKNTVGLLEHRIESLDDMTKSTLTAGAIIGMRFEDRWLPSICGLEEGHTTAALAEARRAMLVEPARLGTHRFVHDSIREVLLKSMSEEARCQSHQRAAETLDKVALTGATTPNQPPPVVPGSATPPSLAPTTLADMEHSRPSSALVRGDPDADACYTLASHYARGIPGRTLERVYQTNLAAGRLAFDSFDNERALSFFRTAEEAAHSLQLPRDPSLDLLVSEAKLRMGALEASRQQFIKVLAIPSDPLREAWALSRIAWIYQLQLDSFRAWQALQEAFAKIGKSCPTDSPWMALRSWASWLWSRIVPKSRLLDALERQELDAVCSLYYQAVRLASLDAKPLRIITSVLRGVVPAERLGPSTSLARMYMTLAFVLIALGRRKVGRKYLRKGEDIARATADPVTIAQALQIHVVVASWDGDLKDAIDTGRRCLEEYGHWREFSEYCLTAYNQQMLLEMCGRSFEAWQWMERIIERVELHEGARTILDLIEVGARAALTCIGREREADQRLRKLLNFTTRVPENSSFHTWTFIPRLRIFTERGDLGPEFEALVAEFEAKSLNPRRVHLAVTQFYIHLAHARVHALLRLPSPERQAALPKLAVTLRDLKAAARIPVIRGHALVIDAYHCMFVGAGSKAERLFADSEQLGQKEDAPWVLYAVHRGRAHLLQGEGRHEAARDQARLAEALASEHGMAYRLRWIREEFDLSRDSRELGRRLSKVSGASTVRDFVRTKSAGGSSGKHLQMLSRLADMAREELDPTRQGGAILDEVIRAVRAERGFLFLTDADGDQIDTQQSLRLLAGRLLSGEVTAAPDEPTLRLSSEAFADWSSMGQAVGSYLLSSTPSRAILSAPLCMGETVVGVLWLDRDLGQGSFSESDGEIVVAFSDQVPVAMKLAQSLSYRRRPPDGIQAIQEATTMALSSRQPHKQETASVNDRILALMASLERLLGPAIVLTTRLDTDVHLIQADPDQIDQMLKSFAARAHEVMHNGGGVLLETSNANLSASDVEGHPTAKPGAYVRISISDTGRAMDPEEQRQMFEPFATQDGSGARLALGAVYRNVARSNGFIDIESIRGEGTTFRIYWPKMDEKVAANNGFVNGSTLSMSTENNSRH